jgi:hypothetical protein
MVESAPFSFAFACGDVVSIGVIAFLVGHRAAKHYPVCSYGRDIPVNELGGTG